MSEGPSRISGPIPPDPSLFPECYKRPSSARGRLEGNSPNGISLWLNGPLAPEPSLYPGCYSARTPHPPRVGPNATHILKRDREGEVGAILKLEGTLLTPSPIKHKPAVRDYGKENARRLREIQRRFREQEVQKDRVKPAPVKALWTSSKYENTPSRFMALSEEKGKVQRPECKNFLKAHSVSGSGGRSQSQQSSTTTASLSGAGPNTTDSQSQLEVRGHIIDFVSHNARAAGKTTLRRSQSMQNLHNKQPPSAIKGQVPQYLEDRKEQWRKEANEKKKNTPDPSIPAGHSQMSDKERQETLQSLKETHRSLVSEMLSLPMRTDTLSVRSRRAELDRRLSEVEEAIKIFSREKVYIKNDS